MTAPMFPYSDPVLASFTMAFFNADYLNTRLDLYP
jgi:hypothetical protein